MEIVTSWMEEGRQQGLQQGLLQKAREAVIEVLETRFGDIPYPLREAVTAMPDLDRLKQWHRAAIQVPSLDSFKASIHEG